MWGSWGQHVIESEVTFQNCKMQEQFFLGLSDAVCRSPCDSMSGLHRLCCFEVLIMSPSFICAIKNKCCWRLKPFVIFDLEKKCFAMEQVFLKLLQRKANFTYSYSFIMSNIIIRRKNRFQKEMLPALNGNYKHNEYGFWRKPEWQE